MDVSTIVIIGLIIVIIALLDDMKRARSVVITKTKRLPTVPIVSDGFVYPWWRNYYFSPRGYYISPFRLY